MMIQRIKKMQLLCAVCLILQLVCYQWIIPFHFIAVCLSLIVIINQRCFKVIQIQYHFYLIGLYLYRLWVLSIQAVYLLQIIYVVFCLYIAVMLLLFSFHCIL